ncbi:hypothetical protein LEP1GSC050_4219 [Leptospira broomii serovar Hurstbridge str. 5399]|uniref:Uncharacterized protein n=1 Tax=Leptospira broomii serovar Hurstbridge str. 5399 TaxID=1049789 RepID=T0EYJ0_9LEPT|nr:hypothetical protein LEP1GSC050_4219 [Leptospira broomii serovar Hurstbridge str. 5399]
MEFVLELQQTPGGFRLPNKFVYILQGVYSASFSSFDLLKKSFLSSSLAKRLVAKRLSINFSLSV